MKYFPPRNRNRPAWEARVRSLENLGALEDDPTVVDMVGYLLVLDDMCNHKSIIARTEAAKAR
jgi:hypothetical protein